MHRHMTGALHHNLNIMLPGDFREFSQRFQLSKLGFIIGVCNGARTQSVTQGNGYVVGLHNFANFLKMRI
ncbi:hypothetical protein D3C80_1574050 [compost metagenome]